jgi:hypothetical protein
MNENLMGFKNGITIVIEYDQHIVALLFDLFTKLPIIYFLTERPHRQLPCGRH